MRCSEQFLGCEEWEPWDRPKPTPQRYRASGLTLVTAAIALWNTVYIERAVQTSARNGQALDPELFKYLYPLGSEHINLTDDYQWQGSRLAQGRFRSLRTPNHPCFMGTPHETEIYGFFRTFGAGWAARHDASRCTPVV
jgi:hypothetical protein